ncbi:MAG: N-acetylmuramoyl-L-alanine amidase [Acidimicrobiia bacterium]|nr:N-acetylmuramoyl-L-alanine amidase [Acidimicrobiia bacterium]NND13137.1 N-acetylmuramoyl-L-alanine amidase [Acidimicrobiia bacterium]NNL29153.1 N-acetylmuramoyl-L-alanine amidase [Acidimicrobiia bacterium]
MPVTHVQVLIDPGHGGDETGAVASSGLRESDLNLDVAERLQRFLEYRGVSTLLTRTDDYRVAIAARGELAQRVEPDVFISIHHNGGPTTPTREPGTLVFHQVASSDSRRLAGLVYEELVTTLSSLDVSYAAGSPPGAVAMLNDSGLDYYGVLRRTDGITSVLSESFFLTNPAEAAVLESGYVREQEAIALGKAILRFMETEDAGTGFLDSRTFEGPGSGTGGIAGCSDPDLL